LGKRKTALIGEAFADNAELLQSLMEVLNRIPREKLEAVVEEWLLRFDRCIQPNEEYVNSFS
jgi:hypothetical protein